MGNLPSCNCNKDQDQSELDLKTEKQKLVEKKEEEKFSKLDSQKEDIINVKIKLNSENNSKLKIEESKIYEISKENNDYNNNYNNKEDIYIKKKNLNKDNDKDNDNDNLRFKQSQEIENKRK